MTSLPRQIGQLESLRSLYLAATGLTSLPPELGRLGSLVNLTVPDGLKDPPPDIVRQGTEKILDYLRKRMDSGSASR